MRKLPVKLLRTTSSHISKPKKKILVIGYTGEFGGGEINLEKSLHILKDIYHVYLLSPRGILADKVKGEINVIISKGVGQLYRASNRFWLFTLLKSFAISFFEVSYLLFRLKPDIVHCFSEIAAFYTILPARILGNKIICETHIILERNIFWEKLSCLMGLFIHYYIVPSKAVRARMIEIGHDWKKFNITYSIVDTTDKFIPQKVPFGIFRKQFGLSSTDKLIGIIGAVYPLKGQHIFLEAVNILNKKYKQSINVKYVIIGGQRVDTDRIYMKSLKDYVNKYNLTDKVIFTGNITTENIPNALKDIDIIVFCSCLPDAFPRTVLEAMAMEKIVIASNIGGVPEQIVDGFTGFLYTPEDSKELAQKIDYVNNNHPQIEEMGLKAREVVINRFSEKIYKKNFLCVYRRIINKK